MPIEQRARFRSIKLEVLGFPWVHPSVWDPLGAYPPRLRQLVCDPGDTFCICVSGTKVPSGCKVRTVFAEPLAKEEVAMQRFKHELPRSDGGRIADLAGLAGKEGTDEIGNELVAGPIAAANRISGAGAGKRDAVPIERLGREVRLPVR